MNLAPTMNTLWRHYKGGLYKVRTLATMEGSLTLYVVYDAHPQPLARPWIRPLKEWNDLIEYKNESLPRFTLVEENK